MSELRGHRSPAVAASPVLADVRLAVVPALAERALGLAAAGARQGALHDLLPLRCRHDGVRVATAEVVAVELHGRVLGPGLRGVPVNEGVNRVEIVNEAR